MSEDSGDDFIIESYRRMQQTSKGLPYRKTSRGGKRRHREVDPAVAEEQKNEGWVAPPGIARSLSGTGKSWRDPQALASVLERAARQRRWSAPLSLGTIVEAWPQIVGDAVAAHSQVESLEEHRLQVRTDSTAWAKQLQLLIPQIEKRIDQVVGTGAVTQVVVHGPQRPSWKHGMRSVSGPGPRDTYG